MELGGRTCLSVHEVPGSIPNTKPQQKGAKKPYQIVSVNVLTRLFDTYVANGMMVRLGKTTDKQALLTDGQHALLQYGRARWMRAFTCPRTLTPAAQAAVCTACLPTVPSAPGTGQGDTERGCCCRRWCCQSAAALLVPFCLPWVASPLPLCQATLPWGQPTTN